MLVYVTMICDRHCDPEPHIHTTAEAAIAHAKAWAANFKEAIEETIEGWLYHANCTVEGDCVWVIERTLLEETHVPVQGMLLPCA